MVSRHDGVLYYDLGDTELLRAKHEMKCDKCLESIDNAGQHLSYAE